MRRLRVLLLVGGALAMVAAGVVLARRDGSGSAQPPRQAGSWSDEGFLDTNQGTAAAVVLSGGRVVVIGGGVGSRASAATELLDPATNKWVAGAPMHQGRRGHQAVVLGDGRILVAGGVASGKILSSAEIFDPAAGTWTTTASMSVPRLGHSLTVLPGGGVLAAGGTSTGTSLFGDDPIVPLSSAEIFEEGSGTWIPITAMGSARFEHTATVLADGRLLMTGGLGPAGPRPAGAFSGTQPDGRTVAAAAVGPLVSTELYDPAVNAFVKAADLSVARFNHAGGLLVDGSVIAAGGSSGPDADMSVASVERFDPGRGSWSPLPPLAQARTGETLTVLPDGRVLVVGGEVAQGGSRRSLATAEIFEPLRQSWRPAGSMRCPRSEEVAVTGGDGTVLVLGGDAVVPGQPPKSQGCAERYRP